MEGHTISVFLGCSLHKHPQKHSPKQNLQVIMFIRTNNTTRNNPINRGFQPFSSQGTHKLITKILWHTQNIFLPI